MAELKQCDSVSLMSVFDDIGGRPCTEFEIQAWLWANLRTLGFRVRGEFGFSDYGNRFRRADLVIFAGTRDLGIEVKADGKICSESQLRSYREGFVSAMSICGQRHAEKFIETIREYSTQELEAELKRAGASRIAGQAKVMAGWQHRRK